MTPGRSSRHNQPLRIETIFLGVSKHPMKGTAAFFNGSGSARLVRPPIIDVHHIHAACEIRQKREDYVVFCVLDPTAP